MIRIGTRGSQLALWQAHHIADHLRHAGHAVSIEVIRTTGDRLQEVTFAQVGTKGMFTLEIEQALAAGRIDLAVHSLKDLPTTLPDGFVLAATPPRVDARDVLVSQHHRSLADLPVGARLGTSSLRRRAQLLALRPDLEAVEFRGNVDTRLRKLAEGQVDAILLAAAGLDRLEKTDWLRERIAPEHICPSAGQGALGLETRADDSAALAALRFLDDPATRFAVTAERTALAALGGGCQVPVGVHCRRLPSADPAATPAWEILAVVADPGGHPLLRARCTLALDLTAPDLTQPAAADLGQSVARQLLDQGAAELLRRAEISGSANPGAGHLETAKSETAKSETAKAEIAKAGVAQP